MIHPGRCSIRPRDGLFLRGRRALLLREFVSDATMVSDSGAFLLDEGLQHDFQEKHKRFGTHYVIAVDRYFPKAGKTTGSGNGTKL